MHPPGDSFPTSGDWLGELRRGDLLAWKRMTELYAPLVYVWCRRLHLREQEVPDVCQQVLCAVAGGLHQFTHRGPGSFRAWLRQLTHSKVCDHFRQQSKFPPAEGGSSAQERLASLALPEVSDEESERVVLLRGVLQRLRPEFEAKSWQAFWAIIDGKSSADIAKDLDMTADAVRQCKARILRRLRDELCEI